MTFNGSRVRQARELRGLTQKELARRIGKSQAAIAYIERGFKLASAEMMEAIAKHTRFPLAFFRNEPFAEIPIESLMFRARASLTRRQAVEACRFAEVEYEVWDTLSEYVTSIPLKLNPIKGSPIDAARQVRATLGLSPDQPVAHLLNAIEMSGLAVLYVPVDLENVDAFSTFVHGDEESPIIAVCGNKPGDRVRWSVAHELGHIVLHSKHRLRPDEHVEADQFAGEFLLPEDALRREISTPVTLSGLAQLKPRWGVSIQALIRRAFDLRIISQRQYRYLFEKLSAKGWRRREPENLDIPAERPRALRKMAEIVYGSPIDYKKMATECNLSPETIRTMLEGFDSRQPSTPQESRPPVPFGKVIPMKL